jgi:hypothetical protein
MNDNDISVLGVFPPFWRNEGPHFILPHFKGMMKTAGVDVQTLDLNIEAAIALRERWEAISRNCDNIWNTPLKIAEYMEEIGIADRLAEAITVQQPSWLIFLNINGARYQVVRYLINDVRARFSNKIRIAVGGPVCLGLNDPADVFPGADLIWSGTLAPDISIITGRRAGEISQDIYKQGYYPDYTGIDITKYSKPEQLIYILNYGCPFRCQFCLQGAQYVPGTGRSVSGFSDHLKTILAEYPTLKYFRFYDSSLNSNHGRFLDLLNELDGKNILWGCFLAPMPYVDRALGIRMLSAGCIGANMGVESGSSAVRKRMGKPTRLDVVESCIRELHAAGIYIAINLMIGYPGETENDVNETLLFTNKMSDFVSCVSVNKTVIYAGTPLFANAEKLGINLNGDIHNEFVFNRWALADGSNTPSIREERLLRMESHIERLGLKNARLPDAEDHGLRALEYWNNHNQKGDTYNAYST